MEPMFEPETFGGKKKVGKYSFTEDERTEIFTFAIAEIRKHAPDVTIALCKESASVWEAVGLELSRCACVCQFGAVDMAIGAGTQIRVASCIRENPVDQRVERPIR